jgi:hypothetical protein
MDLNLAVVLGPLSTTPDVRTVPSGARVASFSVRTRAREHTTSVPVSWWDPPAWIEELAPDDELLVLGTVRRRFFRTATGPGSRVALEAAFVGPPGRRQRASVRRRIEAGLEELDV